MEDNITAIVLSRNNGDTLEGCLKSVVNSLPHDKEVIVVDGKSTDNTSEILGKYKDQVKVIYDEGKGLGWARNLGVKTASHNIIAFVDSDVICAKDHFQKFLNYYHHHPDIDAVDTAGRHPEIGTKLQKLESLFWKIGEHFSKQTVLRGWSMSARRKVFDAVGSFPRGGCDDIYFSYEARIKGFKLATISTNSWHMPRPTLTALFKELQNWAHYGAYFYDTYKDSPITKHDHKNRKLAWLFPNIKILIFVAHLASPVTGVPYLRKSRKVSLYLYFILRQYIWLLGYVRANWEIQFHREDLFA